MSGTMGYCAFEQRRRSVRRVHTSAESLLQYDTVPPHLDYSCGPALQAQSLEMLASLRSDMPLFLQKTQVDLFGWPLLSGIINLTRYGSIGFRYELRAKWISAYPHTSRVS